MNRRNFLGRLVTGALAFFGLTPRAKAEQPIKIVRQRMEKHVEYGSDGCIRVIRRGFVEFAKQWKLPASVVKHLDPHFGLEPGFERVEAFYQVDITGIRIDYKITDREIFRRFGPSPLQEVGRRIEELAMMDKIRFEALGRSA